MFRYRCPHCTKLLQAPEVRAGKTTVCSKCSQALTIPIDKSEWLNERGEQLLHSPTIVIKTPPPVGVISRHLEAEPVSQPRHEPEPDTDVFAAISEGSINSHGEEDRDSESENGKVNLLSSALSAILGGSSMDFSLENLTSDSTAGDLDSPILEPTSLFEPTSNIWSQPMAEVVSYKNVTPKSAEPKSEELVVSLHPPEIETIESVEPVPREKIVAKPSEKEPLAHSIPGSISFNQQPLVVASANGASAQPPAVESSGSPGFSTKRVHQDVRRPYEPDVVKNAEASNDWASRNDPRWSKRLVSSSPTPPPRVPEASPTKSGEARSSRIKLDYVSDLTVALTTRMKPPPSPPRDLRPSTALWMLTTGAAVILLLLTLISNDDYTTTILGIGIFQVLAGYLSIIYAVSNRGWQRGALCALFPLTLWYLIQFKYGKLRPFRFFATGVAILVLAKAGSFVRPRTLDWAGVRDPASPLRSEEAAAQPAVVQLDLYLKNRNYDSLILLLKKLATTDPIYSREAPNRDDLAKKLRELCNNRDQDIKVEAMAAYAAWGGEASRLLCMEATRSTNQDERIMAMRLLTRWKDPEVARAIAARIGRPGLETNCAEDALIQIGGPVAERATIPLLRDPNDQGVRLTAIKILGHEKVGGPESVSALREDSLTSTDVNIRKPAADEADKIQARLNKAKSPKQ